VVECLPSKLEALTQIPVIPLLTLPKKKEKEKNYDCGVGKMRKY
jgi:hypothetical protein